jgi:hypothetical protein
VPVAAAIAMASWSVNDPSLNHATAAPVRNLVGTPGAIVADLLLQVLGLGAVAFLFAPAVWGVRLMRRGRLTRPVARVGLWLAGTAAAAATGERSPPNHPLAASDRARRRHGRRSSWSRSPDRLADSPNRDCAGGARFRRARHPGAQRRVRARRRAAEIAGPRARPRPQTRRTGRGRRRRAELRDCGARRGRPWHDDRQGGASPSSRGGFRGPSRPARGCGSVRFRAATGTPGDAAVS